MIAGGTRSVMTPLAITAFGRSAPLQGNDTPEQACAPFSASRDGTIVGEGAAIIVLETLEHAGGRGAAILAEIAGYALTSDAFHLVAPHLTARSRRGRSAPLDQDGEAPESWVGFALTARPPNSTTYRSPER